MVAWVSISSEGMLQSWPVIGMYRFRVVMGLPPVSIRAITLCRQAEKGDGLHKVGGPGIQTRHSRRCPCATRHVSMPAHLAPGVGKMLSKYSKTAYFTARASPLTLCPSASQPGWNTTKMTEYNIALVGFGGVNRALAQLIAERNQNNLKYNLTFKFSRTKFLKQHTQP